LAGTSQAADDKPVLVAGCRDAILGSFGEKDCWTALAKVGAEGFEADLSPENTLPSLFHATKKYSIATDEKVEELAADVKAAGLKLTSFCMHNQFDARPDFEMTWCTHAAKVAQTLGVKAIRIDVVPSKLDPKQFQAFAIKILAKIIEATESTGVKFGIENHGHITNDPKVLKAIFAGVGSDRLGLTLDTANFYWFGHPLTKLYDLFEAFASRVVHTHCKSINYPVAEREKQRPIGWKYDEYQCPIDKGNIDFARVIGILRKAGYQGDLCVEDEALGKFPQAERAQVLAREIQYLKDQR
jgi:sugar phosphate isomerase/epimerase